MLKFIIDIFCKDTVIGLSQFENIRRSKIYKNRRSKLFKNSTYGYNGMNFTDPIVYHL